MDFPDKQGRSAEEAAKYWRDAYWNHMLRRSGPEEGPAGSFFREYDIQNRSLIDIILTLKEENRRLRALYSNREMLLGFHKKRWNELKPTLQQLGHELFLASLEEGDYTGPVVCREQKEDHE